MFIAWSFACLLIGVAAGFFVANWKIPPTERVIGMLVLSIAIGMATALPIAFNIEPSILPGAAPPTMPEVVLNASELMIPIASVGATIGWLIAFVVEIFSN